MKAIAILFLGILAAASTVRAEFPADGTAPTEGWPYGFRSVIDTATYPLASDKEGASGMSEEAAWKDIANWPPLAPRLRPYSPNDGIVDGATHLRSYQIRRTAGSPAFVPFDSIEMVNQIGTIVLDALTPGVLLVPAAMDLVTTPSPPDPAAHAVDHYKCYKARVTKGTPKFPRGIEVLVADEFTSPAKRLAVKKVRRLCVPVDKNDEGIRNPAAALVCYQSRPASGQPRHQRRTVFVSDQFGPGTVETIKEDELCIPSLMNP